MRLEWTKTRLLCSMIQHGVLRVIAPGLQQSKGLTGIDDIPGESVIVIDSYRDHYFVLAGCSNRNRRVEP